MSGALLGAIALFLGIMVPLSFVKMYHQPPEVEDLVGGEYRYKITFTVTNWGLFKRQESYVGRGSTVWYRLPDFKMAGTSMSLVLLSAFKRWDYETKAGLR